MSDGYLDAMGGLKGKSEYTQEEIRQAEKRKKKYGGTLAENLLMVTGRQPSMTLHADPGFSSKSSGTSGSSGALRMPDVSSLSSGNEILAKNQQILDQQIRELNENLARDFGVNPAAMSAGGMTAGSAAASVSAGRTDQEAASSVANAETLSGQAALDAFAGVSDELAEKVFGQEEFLKKLVIGFKRPFVMPPEDRGPGNVILLTGKNDTGKHYALCELLKLLAARKVLHSADIRIVDLGIYPDASMEKIFLQDIYAALSGSSDVILFERVENCHPSFLTQISALVTEGRFRLSERYVLQKGQLVGVQNALASDAVSELFANGKYLVFLSEKPLAKIAGVMGAPFVDALGDICVTKDLEEDALSRIAACEQDKLTEKAAKQFSFVLSYDENFLPYSAGLAGREAGVKGIRDFYVQVLQALAQAKLEGDYPADAALVLSASEAGLTAVFGDKTIDLSALLPGGYRGEIDQIRRELDEIVGLSEIKEYVLGLEEYYKVQKRRREEGLKTAEVSKHMIFTGSPGTGKTTIARIISRYLKAIGVLTGGQLVEVSRGDLVGRYVGHTAPLTNQVLKSAIGGVLFIDEAYSLYRGKDDSYGLEAIDTLVKGIEDNRDNLIVILAGYSKEMQEFLTSNSGLKSRFPNIINFPDYTGNELLLISRSIAKSKGYTIDGGADQPLTDYFDAVQAIRAADAGNGRLARNLVEEAILNQSKRLVAEPEADLSTLVLADFSEEVQEYAVKPDETAAQEGEAQPDAPEAAEDEG
ncbi:MAG: AAA family ATPase [Lachnospiraceae bacterium]|nr:AAA family ATPase [Lachnospiraceae bacterium]